MGDIWLVPDPAAARADATVRGWFRAELWNAYLSLKENELETVSDMTLDAQISAYRNIY